MSLGPLTFRPVDRETWADFESLFNAPSGPKYCWCMSWRATAEEGKATTSAVRHDQIEARVHHGIPIGLVVYDAGLPVAWVSLAPKETFRRLGGPEPAPGEVVWSLTCMFAARSHRKQGIADHLIAAALEHVKSQGGTVLEAYPVAPDSPSYRYMGFVPAFERHGFVHLGKEGSRRNVMRKVLGN